MRGGPLLAVTHARRAGRLSLRARACTQGSAAVWPNPAPCASCVCGVGLGVGMGTLGQDTHPTQKPTTTVDICEKASASLPSEMATRPSIAENRV